MHKQVRVQLLYELITIDAHSSKMLREFVPDGQAGDAQTLRFLSFSTGIGHVICRMEPGMQSSRYYWMANVTKSKQDVPLMQLNIIMIL